MASEPPEADLLRQLEEHLLRPEVRGSAEQVGRLLADDFVERQLLPAGPAQAPGRPGQPGQMVANWAFLVARDGLAAFRDRVRKLDPHVPLYGVRTMEQRVTDSLLIERLIAGLSAAFGLLATVLASVLAPTAPAAPERFSMTTFRPKRSCNRFPTIRATVSGRPPAG